MSCKLITGDTLKGTRLFKITNRSEWHRGVQYTTGEITDIIPFNDNVTELCCAGGLYFGDLDGMFDNLIVDWSIHTMGCCNIREVSVADDERVVAIKHNTGMIFRAHTIRVGEPMPLTEVSTWKYLYELSIPNSRQFFLAGVLWAWGFDLIEIYEYLREVLKIPEDANIHTYLCDNVIVGDALCLM